MKRKETSVTKSVGGLFQTDAQSGIGLIEVLIALLVLSVGILGLAGMQLNAKRASFEATQRSIATSLARDLLERMRSNPAQLAAYESFSTDLATGLDVDAFTTAVGTNCTTEPGCSPAALAAWDMTDWLNMVKGQRIRLADDTTPVGGLLNPFVCLHNGTGAATGRVTVVIAWRGVTEIDQSVLENPGGITGIGECGDGEFDATTPVIDDGLRRQLTMTTFITTL